MADAVEPMGRRRARKPGLDLDDAAFGEQPLISGTESVADFEALLAELESAPPPLLGSTHLPLHARVRRPQHPVCEPVGRADERGQRRESAPPRHLNKLVVRSQLLARAGSSVPVSPTHDWESSVRSLPRSSSFLDRRSRLLVRLVSSLLIFAAMCGIALALAVSVRILALDETDEHRGGVDLKFGLGPRSAVSRLHRTHLRAVRSGAGLTGLTGLRLRSKELAEALPPLTTEPSWTTSTGGHDEPAQQDGTEGVEKKPAAWRPPSHGALKAHFFSDTAGGARLLIGAPPGDDGASVDDWRIA